LVESFKLVPSPLDEGPRPKSGKLKLNLHSTPLLEGKSVGLDQKNNTKRIAHSHPCDPTHNTAVDKKPT